MDGAKVRMTNVGNFFAFLKEKVPENYLETD